MSCSPESGSNPEPIPMPSLKLTKIVETNSSYTYTTNFIYSGDVLLREEGTESPGNNTFKTEFNYVNNKLQSLTYYDNNVLSGTNTFSYTGELITSSLSNESNIDFTHNYIYNSSNQMKNEKQYSNGNLDGSTDYEYNAQGNIFKALWFSGFTSYEYDTNKNPYSLIFSDAVMKIYGIGYSKNNISKQTDSNGSISTFEFAYNDSAYPTQIIEKQNGISVVKTTFTYN